MDKETIGALLLDAMMHAHPSIKEGCNPRPSLEVYKNNEQEYMAKHADQGIQDNKEDQPSKKAVRWVDQVDQVGGAEPKTLEEKVYFKSTMRGGSPALGQDPNKACYKEGVDSILIYNKKDCTGLHPNAKTAVFEITKKHLLKPIPPAGQGNHHATQIRREKAETSISMDLF